MWVKYRGGKWGHFVNKRIKKKGPRSACGLGNESRIWVLVVDEKKAEDAWGLFAELFRGPKGDQRAE